MAEKQEKPGIEEAGAGEGEKTTAQAKEIEAAEKEHEETQAGAMDDLLSEFETGPPSKPGDDKKPPDQKPEKEEGRSAEGEAGKAKPPEKPEAKKEGIKPEDTKAEPPPGEVKAGEQKAEPRPETKTGDLEDLYEIKGPEGMRMVKASDLVNTYQQFSSLQQQHLAVKPIIDLSRESRVPLEQIFAYTIYGIKKAHETAKGKGEAGAGPQAAGEYQGPFDNAETDAYMKESDPKMHASMWTLYRQNTDLRNALDGVRQKISSREAREAEQGEQSVVGQANKVMKDFTDAHKNYFADEQVLKNFKTFLGTKYSEVALDKLDPPFLNAALMHYDPKYFAVFSAEQAKTTEEKKREEERSAFGESGDVRSTTVTPQLTEQQEHMADML